jgi:hypothetical protein
VWSICSAAQTFMDGLAAGLWVSPPPESGLLPPCFVVNAVIPLVPAEPWILLLCAGLFLLAGAPAAFFTVSHGGRWPARHTCSCTRMLAVQARLRDALVTLCGAVQASSLRWPAPSCCGAGRDHAPRARTLPLVLADMVWVVRQLLLLLTGATLLAATLQRRIRRWQAAVSKAGEGAAESWRVTAAPSHTPPLARYADCFSAAELAVP